MGSENMVIGMDTDEKFYSIWQSVWADTVILCAMFWFIFCSFYSHFLFVCAVDHLLMLLLVSSNNAPVRSVSTLRFNPFWQFCFFFVFFIFLRFSLFHKYWLFEQNGRWYQLLGSTILTKFRWNHESRYYTVYAYIVLY